MTPSNIISIVSVSFSILFGMSAIYFSVHNKDRDDNKEIQDRVERDTRVDMKLDEIGRNTADIKKEMVSLKSDIQRQSNELVLLKASVDKAHSRIDTVMNVLDIKNGGRKIDEK